MHVECSDQIEKANAAQNDEEKYEEHDHCFCILLVAPTNSPSPLFLINSFFLTVNFISVIF